MMANKWIQASLALGAFVGMWCGSWVAMIFGGEVLFWLSYAFSPVALILAHRAKFQTK